LTTDWKIYKDDVVSTCYLDRPVFVFFLSGSMPRPGGDYCDINFITKGDNPSHMSSEQKRAGVRQLSVVERVLVHLSRVRADRESDVAPWGACQEGIAEAVGMLRSHVPRAVKELQSDGLVEESKRHVRQGEKRMKVYIVTAKGLAKVGQIEGEFLSKVVPAKINDTIVQGMTVGQLETAFHKRIDMLKLTGEEEFLDLDSVNVAGVTDFTDSPKPSLFLDREEPLEQMKRFLKSRSMALVIYGAKGIGTSSLVKHFIEMLDEWNVLWISLAKHRSAGEVKGRIAAFAKMIGASAEALLESSSGANSLLVIDGYFDVEEELAELFSDMLERRNGAKMIFTCRDSTPSYNRFHRKEHLDAGVVQEMTLKGLPEKDARVLLANDEIPEEAFKRIFALSRGSPMVLGMLRDRDEEGLRRNTTFTNEEIRFLLTEAKAKE
jgi:DNA-binding MarR family transcriptional regulator